MKLELIYCPRCRANHKPSEHLARPKKAETVSKPLKTAEALAKSLDLPPKATAKKWDDGVALVSSAHPKGKKTRKADISAAAVETIEAPPALAAEIERLGPEGIARRKADREKRHAEELADIPDAAARKRALKTARQARWRARHKKPKKKKKAKK